MPAAWKSASTSVPSPGDAAQPKVASLPDARRVSSSSAAAVRPQRASRPKRRDRDLRGADAGQLVVRLEAGGDERQGVAQLPLVLQQRERPRLRLELADEQHDGPAAAELALDDVCEAGAGGDARGHVAARDQEQLLEDVQRVAEHAPAAGREVADGRAGDREHRQPDPELRLRRAVEIELRGEHEREHVEHEGEEPGAGARDRPARQGDEHDRQVEDLAEAEARASVDEVHDEDGRVRGEGRGEQPLAAGSLPGRTTAAGTWSVGPTLATRPYATRIADANRSATLLARA